MGISESAHFLMTEELDYGCTRVQTVIEEHSLAVRTILLQ